MQIWVDADACPKVIKDILFRAAERLAIAVILVANKPLHTPPSPHIRSMVVAAGFDMADNRIVELVQPDDLVITADIPLAAAVMTGGPGASPSMLPGSTRQLGHQVTKKCTSTGCPANAASATGFPSSSSPANAGAGPQAGDTP